MLYNKLPQNMEAWNSTFLSHTVSVGEAFGSDLAVCFQFKVSCEVTVKIWARLRLSEGLPGTYHAEEQVTSRWKCFLIFAIDVSTTYALRPSSGSPIRKILWLYLGKTLKPVNTEGFLSKSYFIPFSSLPLILFLWCGDKSNYCHPSKMKVMKELIGLEFNLIRGSRQNLYQSWQFWVCP